MDYADYFLGGVDDYYGGDFLFFHQVQGLAGEEFWVDGLRVADHAVADGHGEGGSAVLFHEAAEVAVGEDAGEFAVGSGDGGHAEFFGGHFVKGGRHGCLGGDARQSVAAVHEMFDTKKFFAKAAGGMESGEIIVLEAAAVEKGNSECVADGHGYGGAGGGSEIEGAGFFFDADIENDFAGFGERGFGIAGERDDGNFQALERFEEVEDFLGFAAVGDGEESIAAGEHAEIAMEGFGGMQEKGRCTGAGKSG